MRSFTMAIVAGLVLLASACTSPPPAPPETLREREPEPAAASAELMPLMARDLRPRDDRPLFLGVSNRLRDRDEEIDRALLHAAEQAARYEGIRASYRYVSQRDGASSGFLEDIEADWSAARADELLETMEIVAVEQVAGGTLVSATSTAVPPVAAVPALDASNPAAQPEWVSSPPELPGHLVAVGSTLRSRSLRDSYDLADQEALKALLIQAGSTLRMIEDRRSVERQGSSRAVTSAEEAEARLSGFLVVARHAREDGQYLYTLAIAREDN